VEEKLYVGVREQKSLNTTALGRAATGVGSTDYALFQFILPATGYEEN
jgi:hypothetical protein